MERQIMPIKPENRTRYPHNWKQMRAAILDRARHCCEWCGIADGSTRGATKIVLTIAHLDHTPEHNDPDNLRALCQRCHLAYDAKHHQQTAYQTRRAGKAKGDLFSNENKP
ncbi:conserved hypothetical protein [Candidatus Contendobacter odensis Run_B_J11]|uniref:HNH nuclease domain-containing protein n=2 Tax=Candidatus Contendibacter odensensis TaxID=1400860 RepID=A0A7U7J5I7_9GAMM|nr:conserved hypothetical protein [Candidatus Contendobacter odensis Run_B_J11]